MHAVGQLLLEKRRKPGSRLLIAGADAGQFAHAHRLGEQEGLVDAVLRCVHEAFEALDKVLAVVGRQGRYTGHGSHAGGVRLAFGDMHAVEELAVMRRPERLEGTAGEMPIERVAQELPRVLA